MIVKENMNNQELLDVLNNSGINSLIDANVDSFEDKISRDMALDIIDTYYNLMDYLQSKSENNLS